MYCLIVDTNYWYVNMVKLSIFNNEICSKALLLLKSTSLAYFNRISNFVLKDFSIKKIDNIFKTWKHMYNVLGNLFRHFNFQYDNPCESKTPANLLRSSRYRIKIFVDHNKAIKVDKYLIMVKNTKFECQSIF